MAWITTVGPNEELVIDSVTTLRFDVRTRVRVVGDKSHNIEKRPRDAINNNARRIILPAKKRRENG